ncbi:hypothetical protein [Chromobacterium violaceum]|uniref:hypothetical protein n=1 Tax=Chromobacterium violaceum TaxID=536 RepID=UPI0012D2B338|nr:hypothetical protein [Chromobacterium violaceum]
MRAQLDGRLSYCNKKIKLKDNLFKDRVEGKETCTFVQVKLNGMLVLNKYRFGIDCFAMHIQWLKIMASLKMGNKKSADRRSFDG